MDINSLHTSHPSRNTLSHPIHITSLSATLTVLLMSGELHSLAMTYPSTDMMTQTTTFPRDTQDMSPSHQTMDMSKFNRNMLSQSPSMIHMRPPRKTMDTLK